MTLLVGTGAFWLGGADRELTTVDSPHQLAYDEPISGGLLAGLGVVLVLLGGYMWRARR